MSGHQTTYLNALRTTRYFNTNQVPLQPNSRLTQKQKYGKMQPMQIVCQENLNEKLFALYEQLRLQHGALMWWPADTPFEVALGGILTQATSWRNEAGLSRFSRLARLRVKSRYRQRRYRVTQIAFLSPTNLSERFAPGQKSRRGLDSRTTPRHQPNLSRIFMIFKIGRIRGSRSVNVS